jgi:hypothetical protein
VFNRFVDFYVSASPIKSKNMSLLITNDGNDEKRITRFGQRNRKKKLMYRVLKLRAV